MGVAVLAALAAAIGCSGRGDAFEVAPGPLVADTVPRHPFWGVEL